MLHRLRSVLVRPGRDRLSGIVEVETYIGGEEPGLRGGRAKGKKSLVGVVVELKEPRGYGRCRTPRRRSPDHGWWYPSDTVMATAIDDSLLRHFHALEVRLENEPEGFTGEIAAGVYMMSPRPRPRHGGVQVKLSSALHQRFGRGHGSEPPEWFFAVEPEIRSERTLCRLVPDVGGWRRRGAGWPDMGVTPVTLMPDWVAEVLSPGTEKTDRGVKTEAYGTMGVGWLWLVDCEGQRVETFANVRGRMVAGPVFGLGESVAGDPFGAEPVPVADILA